MATKNGSRVKWFKTGTNHEWNSSVEREVFSATVEFDPETNVYTLTISEDGESDVVTEHATLKIAKRTFRKAIVQG